jgi:hypothetical protein
MLCLLTAHLDAAATWRCQVGELSQAQMNRVKPPGSADKATVAERGSIR